MRATTNGREVNQCWSTFDRLHPLLAHAGGGLFMPAYAMDGVKRRTTAGNGASLITSMLGLRAPLSVRRGPDLTVVASGDDYRVGSPLSLCLRGFLLHPNDSSFAQEIQPI